MNAQPTPVASGPSVGVTFFGRRDAESAQVFEHAASRPVRIGAVLKNHIDEREPIERIAAHDLRLRHREHFGGDRVSHLVLHDLWRLARPFGVNDHLRIGEIGNGVEGDVPQRIDAAEHEPDRRKQDDEFVLERKVDNGLEHWISAGVRSSAALSLVRLSQVRE